MDEIKELSNRQLLAISRFLNSTTLEEGCRKARISRTTFYSWLKDDSFKAELQRQRDEMIRGALEKLKTSIAKATTVLVQLMDSGKEETRRLACKDIIEYALKSIELEEIESRLDKVEKVVLERKTYK